LNLRGVSAMNRNDRRSAREFIQQAYKLKPTDAFTLNNMGYLAEIDGDRETADYYYDRAREANGAKDRVTLATRKEAVGQKIGVVAENTDQLVLTKIDADRIARQQQGGPVILRKRDNSAVVEPDKPLSEPRKMRVSDANGDLVLPVPPAVTSSPVSQPRQAQRQQQQPGQSGDGLIMPLPDTQQPTTVHENQPNGGLMMPLPDNQQPNVQPQNPNNQPQNAPAPKQDQNDNGLIMPLPDNQQPNATPPQNAPQSTQPQMTTPNSMSQPQNPPAPKSDGGLLLPLPDNQQPPAAQSPNSQPQTRPQTQPQTTPQTQSAAPQTNSNIGVYTPPPAGGTYTSTSKPKQINDNDPHPKNTSTQKPATTNNGVKKISDQ